MSVMSTDFVKDIEGFLVADGVIDSVQLDDMKEEAKKAKEPFLAHLISSGVITDEQLTRASAKATGQDYVNLNEESLRVEQKYLSKIDRSTAERFMAVAIGEVDGRIAVAMLDANNIQAVDFLSIKIGQPILVYMASESGIRRIISQYETKLEGHHGSKEVDEKGQAVVSKGDSPITKTMNSLLEYAVNTGASDIHIEPYAENIKVRVRVDGVLREVMTLQKYDGPALITRVKIMSRLKIDEHRVPQDGQASFSTGTRKVDLRVAISPVIWGEQIVIRLLDKDGVSLKLEDMGYIGPALSTIRRGMEKPNGMILTSGPTGSGKSTSMYAIINEIKDEKINIITLEDPVEYKMDGINQIQINNAVGLTFASGLRSVLRLDPDVVMVGEIRDKETAQLAVQAALTGHLVLSTVHTNSSAGVLPRLLDMGIEPFLIASTVNTVIGQRLVRRNQKPVKPYKSTAAETASLNSAIGHLLPTDPATQTEVSAKLGYSKLPLRSNDHYVLAKGTQDSKAPDGYKGRAGLYEVFEVNEQIESLVMKSAPSSHIMQQVQKDGMITMREDGAFKALSGITTMEEVDRITAVDNN